MDGASESKGFDPRELRVALVHDWLTGRRGGEKVLEVLLEVFPRAELYALARRRGAVPSVEGALEGLSWIGRLPLGGRIFPLFLPFFNGAMARLDLSGYDLVLSLSHCAAKNVTTRSSPHLCYCLSPARYIWDLYPEYRDRALGRAGPWLEPLVGRLRDRWRRQDQRGSEGVDRFVAISQLIQRRIRQAYGRGSSLVYPPVDVGAFRQAGEQSAGPGERFLALSAIRPNKRVEEVVEAFRQLGWPLDVIGHGSARTLRRLRRRAGPETRILGALDDGAVLAAVARCRALVHAATEDFGIAPVEAMAAGRPVIGYRFSGLADTVVDADQGRTGVLFEDQEPAGIRAGLERFAALEPGIRAQDCRARAELFSTARFKAGIIEEAAALLGGERSHARAS